MMNKNAFDVPNYSNWIFASNKPDPVSVDKDDRRFNVGPYQDTKFKPTDAELEEIPKELQNFHHFLMSYPVNKDQACTVLESVARDNLIELSQTTSESTASAILEGDMQFFLDQLPTNDNYKLNQMSLSKVEEYRKTLHNLITRAKPPGVCNAAREELGVLFDYNVSGINLSPASLSRFLGHRLIVVKNVSVDGKVMRGFPITWNDAAEFPRYLAEHFSDFKTAKAKP